MPKFSYNSIYEKTRNNMTVSVFLMCCKDTDKHITINTSHYQPTCVHSFTHMQTTSNVVIPGNRFSLSRAFS